MIDIWQEESLKFQQFIKEMPENALQEKLFYKNMKGVPHNQPYWQLLVHIINHSTYHRGQLVTMLRQVGYTDLNSIDMTTFFRIKDDL